jgi:SAM-dependent methyltransferase
MNLMHRWLCRSAWWQATVEHRLLPWVLDGVDLGSAVLEVGPGPGVTTALLRSRVDHLTCVEIDPRLAADLARRTRGQNVTVRCEDATATSLPDAAFDGVVSLTMLHHVPSVALQDRLLAEVARLLKPGGVFAGSDSISSQFFRALHLFDTMVVVDPLRFPARLKAAGFTAVEVEVKRRAFRFRARRLDRAQSPASAGPDRPVAIDARR